MSLKDLLAAKFSAPREEKKEKAKEEKSMDDDLLPLDSFLSYQGQKKVAQLEDAADSHSARKREEDDLKRSCISTSQGEWYKPEEEEIVLSVYKIYIRNIHSAPLDISKMVAWLAPSWRRSQGRRVEVISELWLPILLHKAKTPYDLHLIWCMIADIELHLPSSTQGKLYQWAKEEYKGKELSLSKIST
jgi:hypothetical protein